MAPELEKQLKEKYPVFLSGMDEDATLSCMAWGIECGDGWFQIIDDMCHLMAQYCPEAVAAQIKEKLGGLRVYLKDYDPGRADLIIRHAEKQAAETCEQCGAQGSMRSKNFMYKTLCEDCNSDG